MPKRRQKRHYRQGDVSLHWLPRLPDRPLIPVKGGELGRGILARGKTGHMHQLVGGRFVILREAEDPDKLYLKVEEPTTLAHLTAEGKLARHHPHTIRPGYYSIKHEVEENPLLGLRRVED